MINVSHNTWIIHKHGSREDKTLLLNKKPWTEFGKIKKMNYYGHLSAKNSRLSKLRGALHPQHPRTSSHTPRARLKTTIANDLTDKKSAYVCRDTWFSWAGLFYVSSCRTVRDNFTLILNKKERLKTGFLSFFLHSFIAIFFSWRLNGLQYVRGNQTH